MKLHRFLLPTTLLALGFAAPSHAAVVFSNLSQSAEGSVGFQQLAWRMATDFLTDGTPRTITSLTAALGNSSSSVTHTVTFSIFTDNGSGKPGTLVGIFDTQPSIPPQTSNFFTATDAGIALLANTPYWVVGQVNQLSSGVLSWAFDSGQGIDSGPFATMAGTQIQGSANSGGSYSDVTSGNFKFSLADATPVPEPQTWLALLVTVGTFAMLRSWRQRRN